MKGIIFNLVEEVVTERHGADVWDALLDSAGLDGSYTSLGSYPDEDLVGLVGAASVALGVPAEDVLRQLGDGAIPLLAGRYPDFFRAHASTRSFLLTLNDIIHPEVRKLYPGAVVPDFDFETADDGALLIGYRSERRLCNLAEGFIAGATHHYGEAVEVSQPQCMLRGDQKCLIRCSFGGTDGL